MMKFFCHSIEPNKFQSMPVCLAALIVLATTPAVAADANSPLNTAAPVPGLTYESPLVDFRAFDPDEAMVPWAQANDRVGELGGWRAYLKNATKKPMSESSQPGSEMKGGMKHNGKSK